MPSCYFLTLSVGSSLDQHTNNVTLFNLVEQVNIRPQAMPQPGTRVPLEVHAYFSFTGEEIGRDFDLRLALTSTTTGLEIYSEPVTHRAAALRVRTRLIGVPFPPHLGHYDLRVELRSGQGTWQRDAQRWPVSFIEADARPPVTH